MEFPQLYKLSVAYNSENWLKPLAYSLDFNKLCDVAANPNNHWLIPSRGDVVRCTEEDIYPYFEIIRVNLVV